MWVGHTPVGLNYMESAVFPIWACMHVTTAYPHAYRPSPSYGVVVVVERDFIYPIDQWVKRISLRLFGALVVVVPARGLN